ncbi:hypothetical protein Tco_1187560 [Tanacetum coccineum]
MRNHRRLWISSEDCDVLNVNKYFLRRTSYNTGSDKFGDSAQNMINTNYIGTKNKINVALPLMRYDVERARIVLVSSRLRRLNGSFKGMKRNGGCQFLGFQLKASQIRPGSISDRNVMLQIIHAFRNFVKFVFIQFVKLQAKRAQRWFNHVPQTNENAVERGIVTSFSPKHPKADPFAFHRLIFLQRSTPLAYHKHKMEADTKNEWAQKMEIWKNTLITRPVKENLCMRVAY